MPEPNLIGAGLKAAAAAVPMTIKAVSQELARRNATDADVDFSSLDREMGEALAVLARDSGNLFSGVVNHLKAAASGVPEIFSDAAVREWVSQTEVKDAVKNAVRAVVLGNATDQIAFAILASQDEALRPAFSAAFEYAVAFVARSIFRILTPGDRLAQQRFDEVAAQLADLAKSTVSAAPLNSLQRDLLDQEAAKAIDLLRKRRFFPGCEIATEAQALAERLSAGELSQASNAVRAKGLANCARWLSRSDANAAAALVTHALRLGGGEETLIAQAFMAARENEAEGLATLAPIDSASRRTAALAIVYGGRGAEGALAWAQAAEISPDDLDADGKMFLLVYAREARDWASAYTTALAVSPADELATPAIRQNAALARLSAVVAPDQRFLILNGPPMDGADFALADGEEALINRREAARLYGEAAAGIREFGHPEGARVAAIFGLWLRLRDKETEAAAKAELVEILGDPQRAIAAVPLALSFGVKLDREAAERELNRRDVLNPAGSVENAIARYALLNSTRDPAVALAYLQKHKANLKAYITSDALLGVEIRLLTLLGRHEDAQSLLDSSQDRLIAGHRARLQAAIVHGEAGPSLEELEGWYAADRTTLNLRHLVERLARMEYTPRFFELARDLVRATQALPDAEALVRILVANDRLQETSDLLGEIPMLIPASIELQSAQAWNDYLSGDVASAWPRAAALQVARGDRNDRALYVNILVATGKWSELRGHLEAEWAQRPERDAEQLLDLANLAAMLGSSRVGEFAALAAQAAPDDPHILVGCYSVSVKSGLEDDEIVSGWIQRAAELSDEDGPVTQGNMKQLLDQQGDWKRHADEVWQKLRNGDLPLSTGAQLLRRSTLELQLVPMVVNRQERDPRRRTVVPAFSGVRADPDLSAGAIGLDGSAIVTLAHLGLLERALQRPGGVWIPNATLNWLFNERYRLRFHQPSRIKDARALTLDLSTKRLAPFASAARTETGLADEVGADLAEMLTAATANTKPDAQHLVVRSSPVHKVGSLMGKQADLAKFDPVLVSCASVIDKLVERGQLGDAETERARAFLALHEEGRWPHEPKIADGAILYLDDLSVSYLRSAGALNRLHAAGLTAYVSPREIQEANALIELDARGTVIDDAIEAIRRPLANGIERGLVRLAPSVPGDERRAHPNVAVVLLAPLVDAVVSDERFINRNRNIGDPGQYAKVWTSLDLIERMRQDDLITDGEYFQARTDLRRAGLVFIPPTSEELIAMTSKTPLRDGAVLETMAMRAFRENLQMAQMHRWLHLASEADWLQRLQGELVAAILAQWSDEISNEDARARSEWLLHMADGRNWCSIVADGDPTGLSAYGLVLVVNRLLLASPRQKEGGETRLESWLRTAIVEPLQTEAPDIYSWMITHLRELILGAANREYDADDE